MSECQVPFFRFEGCEAAPMREGEFAKVYFAISLIEVHSQMRYVLRQLFGHFLHLLERQRLCRRNICIRVAVADVQVMEVRVEEVKLRFFVSLPVLGDE